MYPIWTTNGEVERLLDDAVSPLEQQLEVAAALRYAAIAGRVASTAALRANGRESSTALEKTLHSTAGNAVKDRERQLITRLVCPLVLIVFAGTCPAKATTWHVPSECSTIQAGIDRAASGDTVVVARGTYHEHDIAVKSGMCLRSKTGEADCVTIDAESLGWVFVCDNVDSTAWIQGFTITGGWDEYGGGMYCRNHASPTLVNCVFSGNTASYGSAMYCRDYSSPTLSDCTFSGNSATHGGGILCYYYYSCPTLSNCTFCGDLDGEVHCRSYSSPVRENVILAFGTTGEATYCDAGGGAGMTCCNLYCDTGGDWLGCIEKGSDIGSEAAGDAVSCDPSTEKAVAKDPASCDPSTEKVAMTDPASCGPDSPTKDSRSPDVGFIGARGIVCDVVSIGDTEMALPQDLYLGPAIPNPFKSLAEIAYAIPDDGDTARAVMSVHDPSGREVRTLIDGDHAPGAYRISWNWSDQGGVPLTTGVYFYRLSCNGESHIRRMVLLK